MCIMPMMTFARFVFIQKIKCTVNVIIVIVLIKTMTISLVV